MSETTQTFGQKAVGLSFNPSGDPVVHELKSLYAKIIDLCHEARQESDPETGGVGGAGGRARLFSIAITEAQGAQMWAVKAATWKD